jgi:hypothetical protein
MRKAVQMVSGRGPWTGSWTDLVLALADVARADLCLARLVEGHADAQRILDQAGRAGHEGVYGVWASRSAGTGPAAESTDAGWWLHGELRFASGAGLVDRALVPAWTAEDRHWLFDVPAGFLRADPGSWRTPAMEASLSLSGSVDAVVGDDAVVGPPGFYLDRPGFVPGGLGPAAVWAGGAESVVDLVATSLRAFDPDPHQLRRLGLAEQAAWTASTVVRGTAAELDGGVADAADLVTRTRGVVAAACDHVLGAVPAVVGPGGLSRNARLARTLADLAIYVRQHPTDPAAEQVGRQALEAREPRT